MKEVFKIDNVGKFFKKNKIVKLNIGCGTDYKKGWLNIDNNSDDNIDKLDLNWDLREKLPFDDESVDFIYSEHFFEHLTPEEGKKTIKDLMDLVKPGGVMRIAMPDLEVVVNTYLNVPLDKDPVIAAHKMDFIKTRAEWMNMTFSWWGHKWIYDYEELQRRLEEIGYTNVKRCKIYESEHPELRGIETRIESYLIAEVTK
jgi:predicted SAM-dependent methyltransferase